MSLDDLMTILRAREEASWDREAWVSTADEEVCAWWRKTLKETPEVQIEIIEEGDYPSEFPNGAVIVDATEDGRLLAVAVLPLRFRDLPDEDIIQALWPDVQVKRFLPRTRFGD